MSYTIPDGDAVDFPFTLGLTEYVAPVGDAVDFDFTEGARFQRAQFSSAWSTTPVIRQRGQASCAWAVTPVGGQLGRFSCAWSIDVIPSFLATFSSAWGTDAVTNQRGSLSSAWSVAAPGNQLAKFNSTWQTAGLEAQLAMFNATWVTNIWSTVALELWMFWGFTMYVDQELQLPVSYDIEQEVAIDCDFNGELDAECLLPMALLDTVDQQVVLDFTTPVYAECVLPLPLFTDVLTECLLPLTLVTDVEGELEVDTVILDYDEIRAELRIVLPMLNDALVVNYDPAYVLLNGETITLISASASVDEGQFGWTASMQLEFMEDYDKFTSGIEFDLVLGGETYVLILDGKQKPRQSQVDKQASISGISRCAVFTKPRSKTITKTWTEDITAVVLAAELFPGETLEWGILDWTIPAPRLAADNEAPYDILSRVVRAAGGVVECEKDGTIYVRYQYPVSTAAYADATPDQEYADADHNFSIDEGIQLATLVNKIRIMDVATSGFADRIEFIASKTDPARGTLRVWPSPWRSTFNLEHTSLPIVSASLIGVGTEQLTEIVEVLRGKGSVSKPIYTIDDFQFLYADLGGIVNDSDKADFTTTSTTALESLVEITYTTRFFEYDAVAFVGAKVQFLVREPDNV